MRSFRDKLARLVLAMSFCIALALPATSAADQLIRVGGTGMGLATARLLGDRISAADPHVSTHVLPSIGSRGAIEALVAGEIDVGIVGRSLTAAEAKLDLREAICVTTALMFASSHTRPGTFARADLASVYATPHPTWPDGTPLKIILRSRAGSEVPYLTERVPEIGRAHV